MGVADERPALVFRAESGERRELSRSELHREVARLAAGLRRIVRKGVEGGV